LEKVTTSIPHQHEGGTNRHTPMAPKTQNMHVAPPMLGKVKTHWDKGQKQTHTNNAQILNKGVVPPLLITSYITLVS